MTKIKDILKHLPYKIAFYDKTGKPLYCNGQNDGSLLPVSNYDQDSDLYLSYPALIGRQGVLARVPLELTKEEAQKLEASAKAIKEKAFG